MLINIFMIKKETAPFLGSFSSLGIEANCSYRQKQTFEIRCLFFYVKYYDI